MSKRIVLVGGGTGGGGVTTAASSLELLQPAIKMPVEASNTAGSIGFINFLIFIELLLLE